MSLQQLILFGVLLLTCGSHGQNVGETLDRVLVQSQFNYSALASGLPGIGNGQLNMIALNQMIDLYTLQSKAEISEKCKAQSKIYKKGLMKALGWATDCKYEEVRYYYYAVKPPELSTQ